MMRLPRFDYRAPRTIDEAVHSTNTGSRSTPLPPGRIFTTASGGLDGNFKILFERFLADILGKQAGPQSQIQLLVPTFGGAQYLFFVIHAIALKACLSNSSRDNSVKSSSPIVACTFSIAFLALAGG